MLFAKSVFLAVTGWLCNLAGDGSFPKSSCQEVHLKMRISIDYEETDWARHNQCMAAENTVTVRINQDKSKYRITAILKVLAKFFYKK